MKTLFLLITLLLLSGCATRFILPSQRFLSPEVQGGGLKSTIEIQKTTAHLARLKGGDEGIKGLAYDEISRTAYQFSTGLFDQFDLVWSHIGSANSLIGGKYQFIGSAKGGGEGHKLSLAYLVGGNEHESDNKDIEFRLNAQEFWGIYGYRMNPFLMPYASFGLGLYKYRGHIKKGYYSGERPKIKSDLYMSSVGVELNYQSISLRIESGFQLIESSRTSDKWAMRTGFGLGYSW